MSIGARGRAAFGNNQLVADQHGIFNVWIELNQLVHRDAKFIGDGPRRVTLLNDIGLLLRCGCFRFGGRLLRRLFCRFLLRSFRLHRLFFRCFRFLRDDSSWCVGAVLTGLQAHQQCIAVFDSADKFTVDIQTCCFFDFISRSADNVVDEDILVRDLIVLDDDKREDRDAILRREIFLVDNTFPYLGFGFIEVRFRENITHMLTIVLYLQTIGERTEMVDGGG